MFPLRVESYEATTTIEVIEKTPEIAIPSELEAHKHYAYKQVVEKWGLEEWESFNAVVNKESGWNHLAQNPHSTAFGIGQFLNSTWKTVGCVKTIDKDIQIDCMIKYIEKSYQTPSKTLAFHRRNNWY